MNYLKKLFFIMLSCFSTLVFAESVTQTWEKAIVYVPGSSGAQPLSQAKIDKTYPVVLFMHGCEGLGDSTSDNHAWGKFLASNGFLVVMPDSLARPDREKSCEPRARRFGLYPPVHGLRQEEIRYANQQIRTQPWFDGKNLVLMGYSEGAQAVIRSKLTGFRGVVATSLTCTNKKNPAFDGVFVAPDTPVLTLSFENDPVLSAEHFQGSCAQKMVGRTNAQHVSIPGKGHGTFHVETAKQAVLQFVKNVTQPL